MMLVEVDRKRWLAAATLHDALRDEDPANYTSGNVYPREAAHTWPPLLLHGPACAGRLYREGVRDEALLHAVAYHTTGHPNLDEMGEYLYLADFLEPGRDFRNEDRARVRARLPADRVAVLLEVIGWRIGHRLDCRGTIMEETLGFWNRVVGDAETE